MEEVAKAICKCDKGSHIDKGVKVVIGAIAGYGLHQLTDLLYDKMIVEGRLMHFIRRNK